MHTVYPHQKKAVSFFSPVKRGRVFPRFARSGVQRGTLLPDKGSHWQLVGQRWCTRWAEIVPAWRHCCARRHAGASTPQAPNSFNRDCQCGGQGGLPSPFSGDFKRGILFGKRIPLLVGSSVTRCITTPRNARIIMLLCGRKKRQLFCSAQCRWRTLSHSAYPGARCG